jgi:glucokinase
MKDIVLAADLGGTNLRMAAVSKYGEIIRRLKTPTPEPSKRDKIVNAIVEISADCMADAPGSLRAISLAVPGTINSESGIIENAPNLPALNDFDLAGAVKSHFGVPVIIENDANAAAVGENWLGASQDSLNSIMMTLGTGVGGGIIVDGKLVRGADGTAGEIGHINVEPDGIPCGCGSKGCVEQYASATAIVSMAARAIEEDSAIIGSNGRGLDSLQIFERAQAGEQWAVAIFASQGYYLGLVLAGLINTLNPEVIIIGGGASAAWDAFFPSLASQVYERSYSAAAARANIVRAKLGDNAGILGAARLGFESLEAVADVMG